MTCSFDHLVGTGEERGRDRKAEFAGSFEIDHKLKFRGLLDRQIGGFCALQNFVDKTCGGFGYTTVPNRMFGPYFGSQIQSAYSTAASG